MSYNTCSKTGMADGPTTPQYLSMARRKSKSSKSSSISPLQTVYRRTLSASVVAHAKYLAVQGDKSAPERQVEQQKATWQSMETRKARLQARLVRQSAGKCAD